MLEGCALFHVKLFCSDVGILFCSISVTIYKYWNLVAECGKRWLGVGPWYVPPSPCPLRAAALPCPDPGGSAKLYLANMCLYLLSSLGIVDLFRLFVASQEGEEWLFSLILDQLSFLSKLEEVWFWPCSQGNLEEPDFPLHWGNCYLGFRILCFSIKVLCNPSHAPSTLWNYSSPCMAWGYPQGTGGGTIRAKCRV